MRIPPPGVYVGTWMQVVTESSSALEQLFPQAILTEEQNPKPKLRSSKKARVYVNLIASFHVNEGYLVVILADVPKCERNWKPTEDQYVIEGPSYGIDDFDKTFLVS